MNNARRRPGESGYCMHTSVLAAGGRLGGFSAPGGAKTKLRMLEREGARSSPPEPAQPSFDF